MRLVGMDFVKMQRRGMLLVGETMKMVIAVICISFLVYLLVALYFSSGHEQERVDAISLIERIEGVALSLVEGNRSEVNGLSPGGWSLVSFAGQERIPNSCAGSSCLCICETRGDVFRSQFKECNREGVCFVAEGLLPNEKIKISGDGSTDVKLYREGGRLGVEAI